MGGNGCCEDMDAEEGRKLGVDEDAALICVNI